MRNKLNVAIIGDGTCGQANKVEFEALGHNVVVFGADRTPEDNAVIDSVDIIVGCVPTPLPSDSDTLDTSGVDEVIITFPNSIHIVRSTLPLEWGNPTNAIVFVVPEFRTEAVLTELASGNTDGTLYANKIIIGCHEGSGRNAEQFALELWQHGSISIMKTHEAIMTKLATNAFLATKVTFFHMVNAMCESAGLDYNAVKRGLNGDVINRNHTEVEGHGPHPFGLMGDPEAKCLPKDSRTFHTAAKDTLDASSAKFMETVINTNYYLGVPKAVQ